MTDRFDLEQQIQRTWNIVDDLKAIREHNPANLNALLESMELMYQYQFERLFEMFEEVVCRNKEDEEEIAPVQSMWALPAWTPPTTEVKETKSVENTSDVYKK